MLTVCLFTYSFSNNPKLKYKKLMHPSVHCVTERLSSEQLFEPCFILVQGTLIFSARVSADWFKSVPDISHQQISWSWAEIETFTQNNRSLNTLRVLLWLNSRYPFFSIFAHNRSFLDISPNFNPLRNLELAVSRLLFPRIYGRHFILIFLVLV